MRHRKAGLKLGRTSSHRNAMFRNMVTSLFKHDRIQTTDAKAKELKRWADHLISLAKRGDLHARRQAMSVIREKDVVHKLFEEAPRRFGDVSGGYTRVVKLGRRPGDAAPVSIIELITAEPAPKKKKPAKKTTRAAAAKKTAVKETPAEKTDQGVEAAPAKKKAAPKKKAAAKEEKPAAKKAAPAKKAAKPKEKSEEVAKKKPATKRKPLTKAAEEKTPAAEEKSAKKTAGRAKKAAPAKKAETAAKKPAAKKKPAATSKKQEEGADK